MHSNHIVAANISHLYHIAQKLAKAGRIPRRKAKPTRGGKAYKGRQSLQGEAKPAKDLSRIFECCTQKPILIE